MRSVGIIGDIKEEGDSSKLRRAARYAAGRGRERAHLLSDKYLQRRLLGVLALEWRIVRSEEICHYTPWRTH